MVKESNIITKSFVAIMLLAIAIVTINNIVSADSRVHIKVLWSVVVLLSCFAILLSLWGAKRSAVTLMIAIFALASITLLLQSNIFSYCGDNICTQAECASGCSADCSAQQCENRKCEPPIESCVNSPDCRCSYGFACAPQRNGSDASGCHIVSCGDGFCDLPETQANCCDDCGCPAEHRCQNHACYFIPPQISLTTRMVSDRLSVTTIAGNPLLQDENGTVQPLVGMFITSTSYLHDASLAMDLDNGLLNGTVPIGDIAPEKKVPVVWYTPRARAQQERLLSVTNDHTTTLKVKLSYTDTTGMRRSQSWSYPFMLLGRNALDEQGSVVLFVTQDYTPKASTAQGIWDELRIRGISVISSGAPNMPNDNRLQFAQETLASGSGNRNDLAILYASALDAKNLSPIIVQGSDGYFVRVRTSDAFVIVDPTRINKPFEDAIVMRPGSNIFDVAQERYDKNYTVLSLNDSLISGRLLTIETASEQHCVCDAQCVSVVSAEHTITNNGDVPTSVCMTSTITSMTSSTTVSVVAPSGSVLDTRMTCYTIAAHKQAIMHHGWRSDTGMSPGCINVTVSASIQEQ